MNAAPVEPSGDPIAPKASSNLLQNTFDEW